MRKLIYPCFIVVIFSLFSITLAAQESKKKDSSFVIKMSRIVPRFGIGMSRQFITEAGIALMRSKFVDHPKFGLNTINAIYYVGVETMTPYKQPMIYSFKFGAETVNIGHNTSAGAIEMNFYKRDTLSSFGVTPKIGLPLINGMLAYGYTFFENKEMKKIVGGHRVTLTYCINRKSNKAFSALLNKSKKSS